METTMPADQRFTKWDKWLDVIDEEIQWLWHMKGAFSEVMKMWDGQPHIRSHNLFFRFYEDMFSTTAVIGIRRQAKSNKESISLARLLEEIRQSPETLSRERYITLCRSSPHADRDFSDYYADGVGDFINPQVVQVDINTLKSRADRCIKFADTRIAHFDKSKSKVDKIGDLLTFEEIEECINFLADLLKKYYVLFRGWSLFFHFPPALDTEWKNIFMEPWLPQEEDSCSPFNDQTA